MYLICVKQGVFWRDNTPLNVKMSREHLAKKPIYRVF